MTLLPLSLQERAALETAAARTKHAHQLRRAQALLWLDAGETVPAVAARLRLGRQAIYKWITQFQTRAHLTSWRGSRLACAVAVPVRYMG